MILKSFSYKQPGWELSGLSPLTPVTLLVARNATGKTRTVKALQKVTSFLQMKENGVNTFSAGMTFADKADDGWKMEYSFEVSEGIITKEELTVAGETLIKRNATAAEYRRGRITPPSDKLVAQTRRDKELYPEIEQLMQWAEGAATVRCSDITPFTAQILGKMSDMRAFSDLVDSLSPAEQKAVLEAAKSLGYNIADIETVELSQGMKLVRLKEESVAGELVDRQLSGGMLRALYLLCFMSAVHRGKRPGMLVIDDLGEGLDYGRSVALGKIIFQDCESNGVQLIASSNDAFLMDVVDIANWQVLRRKNSRVTTINCTTNPQLFKDFRMTGLSLSLIHI